MGDRQNWYEEKNTGCQGTKKRSPPSLGVAGEGVRENFQEEGVFQLKAREKVYPGEQRGRCVSGGGHSACKDQLAPCVRIKDILGSPFWKRAITTAEEPCGRSFRSTPSHWPPAVLRRTGTPWSNQRRPRGRGQRQSCILSWASRSEAEGDQPGWVTVL